MTATNQGQETARRQSWALIVRHTPAHSQPRLWTRTIGSEGWFSPHNSWG